MKYILITFICLVTIGLVLHAKKIERYPQLYERIKRVEDLKLLFPTDASIIKTTKEELLAKTQKLIENIITVPVNKRSFETIACPLDTIVGLSDLALFARILSILEVSSMQESIRTAAHEALIDINNFFVDYINTNKRLYTVFKAYVDTQMPHEHLNEEQRYFIKETMREFEQAGLYLPDEQLEQVKKLKKEIVQLTLAFEHNIAADHRTIEVTRQELQGLDDSFIANLKRTDTGMYILGTDYPTVTAISETCTVENTRKRLHQASNNRAYPVNETILQALIEKRDELARILGYQSFADLDISSTMAQTQERVRSFLQELMPKAAQKEAEEFKLLISDLPLSVQLTSDGKLKPWDIRYAQTMYKKKHFNIDERAIAEYFPIEKTLQGLLAIYKQFLGIEFETVNATGFWHPDVKLVKVFNANKSQLLGYLFLDLFPRDYKFTHAAHFDIIPAVKKGNDYIPAVSVVLANFPKPTADKPALWLRSDVRTFFHEFGHALHAILGATELSSLSGTSVKRDFVEMPSQILEEWLWNKDIIRMISSHYSTGKPLPDHLIDTLISLKQFDSGYWVQTQVFYAIESLSYYAAGAFKDVYAIFKTLYEQLRPNIMFDPANHNYASFGHLTWYAAKYYSYLWAKVYAHDLFAEIKKEGLLNPKVGERYVRDILSKGGSQDPNELLRNFLGREPRMDAFFNDLGL
jgi:thimet oligopeptidase